MYRSFFGFTCKPFQLSPDPDFLFLSGVHKRALTYLKYGIDENFGFILITGEIGTGKTTIIRSMIKQLPREIKLARIHNTKVSSHQLLSMINEDFGLDTKNKDKTELLSELTDFLIKQYSGGGRAVLIIDEAQDLSVDLLEEIRLLSNLETDKSKLLQIILMGQPELNEKLSRPGLEQLRQRIAVSTHISPLGRNDTEAYIMHRLRVAGNEHCVSFEKGVMDEIYEFSQGIPRLINILCEFALIAAFIDSKKTIDIDFIKEIINDLKHERRFLTVTEARNGYPLKPSSYSKIKQLLSSFSMRLQSLEASIEKMQRGNNIPHENKAPQNLEGPSELDKKEEELLKREYKLLQKEAFLRRKEEEIRNLLEHEMNRSPLRKAPDD
jgi:general secretion pathway protein A